MNSFRKGVVVLFTGLPGAGKTTLANLVRLSLEALGRTVSVLDGDEVRKNLSSELGYSREHRDLNLRRVGFVASEVARHGGTALCSLIAPYDAARKELRAMVERVGTFVLVYVSTPLSVCERRDPKGMYAQARRGILPKFTGLSDTYEVPGDADVELDTTGTMGDEGARTVLAFLRKAGCV